MDRTGGPGLSRVANALRARSQTKLQLRFGRRQFASLYLGFEALASMRAVAEGFVLRMAAAAQRNYGAAGEAELLAGGIADANDAFDAQRAIVQHGYFGVSHRRVNTAS